MRFVYSVKIPNGMRHVESGEYEDRMGQKVFIIRGFFEHVAKDVSQSNRLMKFSLFVVIVEFILLGHSKYNGIYLRSYWISQYSSCN